MFHRVPFISPASVVTAAVILVLAALFASPFSSPGVALADHSDRPTVSIKAVMPEVGEEGSYVTVTLKLSRPLTDDEEWCYPGDGPGQTPNPGKCIEGGLKIRDNYNDHLNEEGRNPADTDWKFVFRGSQVEDRINVEIADDECITPDRQLEIWIDTAYQDRDDHPDETKYGYDIDTKRHYVLVNGNDKSDDTDLWPVFPNGTGDNQCETNGQGVTEEADYNKAPTFDDSQSTTFDVDENTAAGQDVGSPVSGIDPENDTLTYSLQGQDAASFDIDSTTGQIKTRQGVTYDHETKDTYHVAVFVRDSKNIYGDSDTVDDDSIDVTINVTDVNEQPMFDANAPTTLNIVENTIAGTDIGSPVTATDPDVGDTLTYSLDTGDGASFEIDTISGQIKTKGALDHEVKDSYTVTVSVTDNKDATGATDPAIDDIHTLTITVDNEVEPPTFNEEPEQGLNSITRSIAENTPAGRPIGNPVAATSEDGATLTYSLDDQDGASFEIDSNGQIKTKDALNYEDTQNIYSVTVSVTDGKDVHGSAESPAVEDDSIDVTINVTDVNEKPVFDATPPVEYEIAENTVADTPIGAALTATDPDPSDTVTYSVSGTDAALFQVDSNGQLQVKEALDFEDKSSLTVVVSATDSRDDSGGTEQTPVPDDSITVTITLTNVFERPEFEDEIPVGEIIIPRSIPENTAADQPVGLPVSATDDEEDTLTYSLDDNDGAHFAIDSATGQIKTLDPLDHEDNDTYSVTVSVTDGKDDQGAVEDSPQEDTFIYVDIEVADVNEPPEFVANLETEPTIAENTDVDQPIGSPFTATDPDDGETLTYGLSGTDAASFDIDTETGQIKTLAALDHETKETYSVTVTVSDGRDNAGNDETIPTADTTMDVTITVTDEDDPGTITLPSNQPSAGVELTATLDDDDGVKTDVDVIWVWESSLAPSDSNSWTVIDGATTNSYTPQQDDIDNFLRVTATYDDELGPGKDAREETDSAVLTMPATNELPSFADDAPMTLSVQENTPAGENIGDPFTATDTDSGDTLTYALDDHDGASFEIDASGQIKTKSALDYETKDTYAVTVSVHDGKDPFGNANTAVDATIDVTINVGNLDIPDAPAEPTVTPTPGAAAGLTVSWTAVTATETMPVDGYDVQYRKKDATPPADWSSANVTVTGATATITGLEYSTTYEVEVRSKNSEGESDWSPTGEGNIPSSLSVSFSPGSQTVNEGNSATFTATVSPAADRALSIPVSASSSNAESGDYSVSGTPLTFASGDSSKTFTVSTTNDSDRNDETVNLAFGQLPAAVGVGSQATASLTINDTTPAPRGGGGGSGGGGTPRSLFVSFGQATDTVTEGNIATITVNVSPAADRTLSIPVSASSSNAESDDYSVSGTPLTFASGDSSKTFTVSTISDSDMDDETVNLAFGNLPVAVGTGTPPTSQLTIEDTTTAQPTNAVPEFASDATTTLFVPENTPAGENIGDPFTATDDDDTTLTYSLDDQDGASFEVDASGQIKTKAPLDHETKASYTVTVSVHDGKGPLGNANTAVDATIDATINVGNLDIPDAPAEPTVTPTPGAAAGLTVSWTAVTATETMPVDGYDVQYRVKDPTDTEPWLTASVTVTGATATITGLEYSTTYEVEVRSKNSEGESDWSPTGEGNIPSSLSVSFSPGSQTVNEGSSATFTVTVSPAADRALSIPVSASSSNAESDDYSVSGTPLTFASGDTTKTFTVSTISDSDMDDETVNLAFGQLPVAVGTGTQATASLTINDTTPAQPTNAVPEFASDATTTLFVPENTPAGEHIGDPFTATDDDDTTLTYSLDDQDGASFEVDASGQIKRVCDNCRNLH